jgi:phospholipase/lecithinase/hemolysin
MKIGVPILSLVIATFLSLPAQAAFSALYVFGDSLSDNGNVFTALGGATTNPPYAALIPSAAYATKNFSNGPIWLDTVDNVIGAGPVRPSLLGGTNFAFGGARTGELTGVSADVIPTLQQQANAAVFGAGGALPSDALYVVWGGGNDVRAAGTLATPAAAVQAISDGVGNIGEIITTLASKGARNFLVPNVPDVGLTPAAIAGGPLAQAGATALAQAFNFGLTHLLPVLEGSLGIDIITVDIFSLVRNVVASPGAFGFTNVTDPCHFANGGLGCSNPDEYFFWDGLHPTTRAHLGVANAFLTAIPLPAALPLLLSALAVAGYRGRRAA